MGKTALPPMLQQRINHERSGKPGKPTGRKEGPSPFRRKKMAQTHIPSKLKLLKGTEEMCRGNVTIPLRLRGGTEIPVFRTWTILFHLRGGYLKSHIRPTGA